MLTKKLNYEDFYAEIIQKFPRIKQLETWVIYDWSVNGYEHGLIMTEISRAMINLVSEGQNFEAQRLMDVVEKYFHEGDMPVTSILYTDFLVTIMEAKKEPREMIKKMMGTETKKHYENF